MGLALGDDAGAAGAPLRQHLDRGRAAHPRRGTSPAPVRHILRLHPLQGVRAEAAFGCRRSPGTAAAGHAQALCGASEVSFFRHNVSDPRSSRVLASTLAAIPEGYRLAPGSVLALPTRSRASIEATAIFRKSTSSPHPRPHQRRGRPLRARAMMFGFSGNPDHDELHRHHQQGARRGINFIDTADGSPTVSPRSSSKAIKDAATRSSWRRDTSARWARTRTGDVVPALDHDRVAG